MVGVRLICVANLDRVIPGRRFGGEPGIQAAAAPMRWIPGSRFARPGMTTGLSTSVAAFTAA